MVSLDGKLQIQTGFFAEESQIFAEQNQREVDEKQAYYENQIQKLYEKIQSLAVKESTDFNLLWAKTREFINFCNKAGEYFLKVQLFDLAKGNFIKAKNSLEKFTANDIQSTTEWKVLKISVYRNLAQYYNKLNRSEKSLQLLKKILPLQQELQKNQILLPGTEFLYIMMGDLAYKLKSYQESVNYAELGIKMLENQLSIESGSLPNFESPEWANLQKDPKVQIVRTKKFIALSYLNYLSGKAYQNLSRNLAATSCYEKAAIISKHFLGPEDKITISYLKKYESMIQVQKSSKEQKEKQKPKSPPKEKTQISDVVSPKSRFIKGQKREELNMILKDYHLEIAAEINSIQKETQQLPEAKEAGKKHRSPSAAPQDERQNLFESRLNSVEKLGIQMVKSSNLKKRQNSATLRSTSLNTSSLKNPIDQQSTKLNTRMTSLNPNESAYENNDLMIFDFSSSNTTMGPFQSRMNNLRVGTPSRNASLAYPLDLPVHLSHKDNSNPAFIQRTIRQTPSAMLSKQNAQDTLPLTSIPQSKGTSPTNLEIEIGNSVPNNLPLKSNKVVTSANTTSENETKDFPKRQGFTRAFHSSSQLQGSTVLMMASRPSSAATNNTMRSNKISNSFQRSGVFPLKNTRPTTAGKQDTQASELSPKNNNNFQSKLDDKRLERPRSASFFGNKAANKANLNLQLPLERVLGGRKFSEGKADVIFTQIQQIDKPSKPKTNIDIKLIQSQINNRLLDLSLSSTSDLEDIISEHGAHPHLKISYDYSKLMDSVSRNYTSNVHHKRQISEGLLSYLKESTKKDLQDYQNQDQKRSSPRRNVNLDHLESGYGYDPHKEGKDTLQTPGFERGSFLIPIMRTDSRDASNSRHSINQDGRPSLQIPHGHSLFKNKPINSLSEFRVIETQAAMKIQRCYRSHKKWVKKKFERKISNIPFFEGQDNQLDFLQKDHLNLPGALKHSIESMTQMPLASLRIMDLGFIPLERSNTHMNLGNPGAGVLDIESQISPIKQAHFEFDLTDFHQQKFSESFELKPKGKIDLDNDDALSLPSDRGGAQSSTKIQEENSNLFSIGQDAVLVRSTTVPLKQLLRHLRIDLIKTALKKLNTSDVKFFKNIVGSSGFWRLSFLGLEDEGNRYRVQIKLKNEFASFEFANTVVIKTAELSMFYATIWPLVLQSVLGNIDLLAEKENLTTTRMDTMVLLPDFRSRERKRKKLSEDEESKIRILLNHITAKAEQELILYRSKLNYALVKKSRFPNGDLIKKNRDLLKGQKMKYYKALHSLATQPGFFNIAHELYSSSSYRWIIPASSISDTRAMDQESIQSIQPHNSPNSQTSIQSQRSGGISLTSPLLLNNNSKQAGSLANLPELDGSKAPHFPTLDRKRSMITHTDQPSRSKSKNKASRKYRRLQTSIDNHQNAGSSKVNEQKRKLQEFQRRSDNKSLTTYHPQMNYPTHGQPTDLRHFANDFRLEDLALFPSKTATIPNPFLPGEMIFQGVIKQHNEFIVITLKAEYSEDAYEFINITNSSFELICEAERLGTEWISSVPIQPKFFSKNIFNSFISFDQKDFLIHGGFSSLQKKTILNFFSNNLTIQNSRIVINKDLSNRRFTKSIVPTFDSLCEFHTFMRHNSLHRSLIFDAYEMFVLQQRRRKMRKGTAMTKSKRALPTSVPSNEGEESSYLPHSDYSMRILNPKDPDYGSIASGGDEPFAKSSGVQWLSLYNEIRCTFNKKYYFIIRENQNVFLIRLKFENINNLDEAMRVSLYQTQAQLCDYITIRDRETIEKIIIILQMKGSARLREKQILGMLGYYRTLVGKKIATNEKSSLSRFNQKIELLPSNIAQVLLASHLERLPKYGLTIEKVFRKAHITLLGDCYVSATIYKIRDLGGYSDTACIKFEVQPFASKTKLYKFLINSNDLQFYLNTQYDAIDTNDHLRAVSIVLSRLWLKRQYLYSSLEIPITNHSSLPNSSRAYSLRNAFENKLEQLKDKEVTSFGRFLESKIQENSTIIQKLRKINGTYFIITVKKHLILNYWAITIYNPRTCRNYITAFYQSDLVSLNIRFLKQMLPEHVKKLETDQQAVQDYANFCKSYRIMLANQKQTSKNQFQQYISFQELSPSLEDETKTFLEDMAGDFLLEIRSQQNIRSLQEKSINPIVIRQKFNFVELKFWENMITQIAIERTVHGISILRMSEFRGVLREYVYRDIVRMSKSEEALVEIFLEHFKHKFEIEKRLEPIPDINVHEYIFFMRVTSIHNMHTYNNKFNLDQAIRLYVGDKRVVQKPVYDKKKKLNLSTVHSIGNFMVYKTKQLGTGQTQSPTERSGKRSGINAKTITPLAYFGLKLNCNFKIQMTIDHEHLFMNKFLIYRSILSLVPLQMVAFVYNENKKYFMAYIYDNQVSWMLKKKIKMVEVRAFIPYASDMLGLGLYEELGSRILKAFKNSLIIHSYINGKSEEFANKQED